MKAIDDCATETVKQIISDIYDRSGLGNEWSMIDDDVQAEIIEAWTAIIKTQLEKYKTFIV